MASRAWDAFSAILFGEEDLSPLASIEMNKNIHVQFHTKSMKLPCPVINSPNESKSVRQPEECDIDLSSDDIMLLRPPEQELASISEAHWSLPKPHVAQRMGGKPFKDLGACCIRNSFRGPILRGLIGNFLQGKR